MEDHFTKGFMTKIQLNSHSKIEAISGQRRFGHRR